METKMDYYSYMIIISIVTVDFRITALLCIINRATVYVNKGQCDNNKLRTIVELTIASMHNFR